MRRELNLFFSEDIRAVSLLRWCSLSLRTRARLALMRIWLSRRILLAHIEQKLAEAILVCEFLLRRPLARETVPVLEFLVFRLSLVKINSIRIREQDKKFYYDLRLACSSDPMAQLRGHRRRQGP